MKQNTTKIYNRADEINYSSFVKDSKLCMHDLRVILTVFVIFKQKNLASQGVFALDVFTFSSAGQLLPPAAAHTGAGQRELQRTLRVAPSPLRGVLAGKAGADGAQQDQTSGQTIP